MTEHLMTREDYEQRKEKLNGLGVYSVLDMLEYFPRDYEDRSVVTKIADITPNSSFGFVSRTFASATRCCSPPLRS